MPRRVPILEILSILEPSLPNTSGETREVSPHEPAGAELRSTDRRGFVLPQTPKQFIN